MYFSFPTWGYCSLPIIYSLLKMTENSLNAIYFWIYHRYSGIRRKTTKAQRVCSNQKQQAVSGKAYTEEQVNKLSAEEVDKLFSNYEAKLSGQMVKSLGKSITEIYSMGACAVLE